MSDHELVASVRAGDDRAFEELYRRYRRRIASYIYGMVNDYGRAEDITQDVFVSALRRMRETDRPIAFKPWVYEIAKNACIDQFRRSRRAEEVSYDTEDGLPAADAGRLAVGERGTPEAAVDRKLALDNLRGAFGGLSETHHEILVLRELEGLSYREIGERLGMTRPSVESTLFRARRRLSEEYEELVSGERCVRVRELITSASGSPLGSRDTRKLARHISHCQPCRRQAVLAGLDVARVPVAAKVAAFLPLPAVLRRRWGGDDHVGSLASQGTTFAHWSAAVAQYVEPGIAGWTKAAAAAATIAAAGIAGGVATHSGVTLDGALPERAIVRSAVDHGPAPVATARRSATAAPTVVSGAAGSGGPQQVVRRPEARAQTPVAVSPTPSAEPALPDTSQVPSVPRVLGDGSGGGASTPTSGGDEAPTIPDATDSLPSGVPDPVGAATEAARQAGGGGLVDQAGGVVQDATNAVSAIVGG